MNPHASEQFVRSLTASQTSVYAYILTLVSDRTVASDLLQDTNVQLWRNADRFEPAPGSDAATSFTAWACKTAYYQVLSWRKSQSRDRLRFDDELLADLADRLHRRVDELDPRLAALRVCLGKLPEPQRRVLNERYAHTSDSVAEIASRAGRPVKTVYQMLFRARAALLACIEQNRAEADR